jgi:hypothetical protein
MSASVRDRGAPGTAVAAAAACLVLLAATWSWRSGILRSAPAAALPERWEQVREAYPPVAELAPVIVSPAGESAEVIQANPFSPQRRTVPPEPAEAGNGAAGTGGASAPAGPAFRYKGRVALGSRERAVLEDTRSRKTHFLEVGQEVAGFKVLDIDEKRVILSDVKTQEEVVVSVATAERP